MNDVTHVNNEYSNGIIGPNGSNRLDKMSKKTRPLFLTIFIFSTRCGNCAVTSEQVTVI